MTYKAAKSILAPLGMFIRFRPEYAEYEVKPKGAKGDAQSYFTNDLEDAVDTGRAMAQ